MMYCRLSDLQTLQERCFSANAGYEKKFLHTQFRIQAPKGKSYTSDDYVNGIKYLLYKDTGLLVLLT